MYQTWKNNNMMFNKMDVKTIISSLVWFAVVISVLFFLVYSVPRKGFDYSDSMGLNLFYAKYFYNSITFHTRYGLTAAFDGIFMLLGIKNYLFYERLYFSGLFIIGLFFAFSVKALRNHLGFAALAIMVLVFAPTSASDFAYRQIPITFILLAFACFFYIENYKLSHYSKNLFIILGCIFCVFSSTANITLLPTIIINWIVIIYFFPASQGKLRAYFYWVLATIGSSLALFFFFYLKNNAGYHFLISVASDHLINHFFSFSLDMFYSQILITVLPVVCILVLRRYAFNFLKRKFFLAQNDAVLLNRLDCCLILLLCLIFLICTLFLGKNPGDSFTILTIYGYMICVSFLTLCHQSKNKIYRQLFLMFLIEAIYYIGLCSATRDLWTSRIIDSLGIFVFLSFLLLENYFKNNENRNFRYAIFITLLLSSFLIFRYQNNVAEHSIVQLNKIKIKNIPLLEGIYTSQNRLLITNKLISIYQKANCENKTFVSWPTSPLYFYLFNRKFISNNSYADPDLILSILKTKKNFCFIDDAYDTGRDLYMPGSAQLMNFLKENSKKIIILKGPTDAADQYAFYIK